MEQTSPSSACDTHCKHTHDPVVLLHHASTWEQLHVLSDSKPMLRLLQQVRCCHARASHKQKQTTTQE